MAFQDHRNVLTFTPEGTADVRIRGNGIEQTAGLTGYKIVRESDGATVATIERSAGALTVSYERDDKNTESADAAEVRIVADLAN